MRRPPLLLPSWGLRLAAAGVSLALSILAANGILALFYPARERPFVYDPECLYRLRPSTERVFERQQANGGQRITSRINSDGFRGRELRTIDSGQRIVVYGDSFIQAEFSELEDTFTYRLERELSSRLGREIEVINAGVIGYGPDQVLRCLPSELEELAPDLVMLSIFADNDFGDLLRNKLYRLGQQGELEEHRPELASTVLRGLGALPDPALRRSARKAWERLSERRRQARESPPLAGAERPRATPDQMDGWLAESRREYHAYIELGERTIQDIRVDHYDADIALDPEAASSTYKVALMTAVLSRMARVLSDTRTLVLVIPSPIDLGSDHHSTVDRSKYPLYDPRSLDRAVLSAAEGAGLEAFSLFAGFSKDDPERLYFGHGDDHWNDDGQALAAALAADFLIEGGWISQPQREAL